MNIQQFGKTESLAFDSGFIIKYELGAITCLDNKKMNDNTTVDVTILTNNIQKIYKTTKALANRFGIADYISPEEKLEKEMGIVKNNSTTTNNKVQQKSTLDTSSNGNTGYMGVQEVTEEEERFYHKLLFE